MTNDSSASIVAKVWNYPPSASVFAKATTDKRLRRAGSEMTELGFGTPLTKRTQKAILSRS